jgi:hypothetical protein
MLTTNMKIASANAVSQVAREEVEASQVVREATQGKQVVAKEREVTVALQAVFKAREVLVFLPAETALQVEVDLPVELVLGEEMARQAVTEP